ncbi:hypothetical protein CF141_04155 [Aeromonas hydrophila]|nr:hypothetical protein CF141_04155 [Aeromonas hydrophila]
MEWPEETLIAAYPALHVSVMEQTIEPFSSVEEARAFWVETGCSLVIIEQGIRSASFRSYRSIPRIR